MLNALVIVVSASGDAALLIVPDSVGVSGPSSRTRLAERSRNCLQINNYYGGGGGGGYGGDQGGNMGGGNDGMGGGGGYDDPAQGTDYGGGGGGGGDWCASWTGTPLAS